MSTAEDMVLIDVNGVPHPLTRHHVHLMLAIGWTAFLLAWLCNIAYYKLHPSAVDFKLERLRNKMFLYFFGKKVILFPAAKEAQMNGAKETRLLDRSKKVSLEYDT